MINASIDFVFYVLEFFAFADGSTVFCGKVDGDVERIPPGEYYLLVDGKKVQMLNIASEMMPKKLASHVERSINTFDSVNLSRDLLGKSEIKIVSKI